MRSWYFYQRRDSGLSVARWVI
ncbi:hypothetical protein RSOL_299260 [Rhizoctonia solani AG-3 Rhs1AP]|uniref:Uncharacterized protein n=1 Tax=Rhizoctonia solani AG-3 Rhs1AP TaxID=1086054 RepID=A0A0A1UJA1_9AGAM|nr:hypothetical protein RSOL_299260 [Rhizoctonia solani AG-3 Rhs1AP]